MPGRPPIYYWDACLFLAWVNDEQRPSGQMDGVREVIARARRREVTIMTSVITAVEVLSAKLPIGVESLLAGLMNRVTRVGVDTKVASVAHDLRDHYAANSDMFQGKTLSTPDAIHLASAILFRASDGATVDCPLD